MLSDKTVLDMDIQAAKLIFVSSQDLQCLRSLLRCKVPIGIQLKAGTNTIVHIFAVLNSIRLEAALPQYKFKCNAFHVSF